jgi:hypothetical protein
MPAVPGTRLGVIEPEFGLRGLERILGRPAAALNCDQCFDPETVWYLDRRLQGVLRRPAGRPC